MQEAGNEMSLYNPGNEGMTLELLIVTGVSGAGKSSAMQSLEDLGYYCVDNLPPKLISTFVDLFEHSEHRVRKIAIAMDLRTMDFLTEVQDALQGIAHINCQLLFLTAEDSVLVQRYKQSRRKHPFANEDSLLVGIQRERQALQRIEQHANHVVDTTRMKPIQLKEKIERLVRNEKERMTVSVMSFGFKYGVPLDADLVFDVRFLKNPHYVDELRPKTGKDAEVAAYVFSDQTSEEYYEKLLDFLEYSVPRYAVEGKQHLVIGIGCTGGKHRSVAITERLAKRFAATYAAFASHRDIGKE